MTSVLEAVAVSGLAAVLGLDFAAQGGLPLVPTILALFAERRAFDAHRPARETGRPSFTLNGCR